MSGDTITSKLTNKCKLPQMCMYCRRYVTCPPTPIWRHWWTQENTLLDLCIWIKSVQTQPDIYHFLFQRINSWLSNGAISLVIYNTIDPSILTACRFQLLWDLEALLHGLLSRHIIACQQDHYSELSSCKLCTRWGVQLIKHLRAVIHLHWTNRNSILHQTEALDLLHRSG